ncbi:MAG: SH3 domain-containing protein [Anaerolineales bacterium]
MRILDPVLVPDVSSWCDHIIAKEFEDGGCTSVVVGLYPVLDSQGNKVLSPVSRQQCVEVATNSSMVLQVYYWDDITLDPIEQANWLADIVETEALPIKWIWADQEQWWTDWNAWSQAKLGKTEWSTVPVGAPANISSHFQNFNLQLHSRYPQSGVYTNKGFVTSWAAAMDAWLPQYRSWVAQYGNQPKEAMQITWADLVADWLPNYDLVLSEGQLPQMVMGHQFTGDIFYLPGSYNAGGGKESPLDGTLPLDVSVFSKAFITAIQANSLNPVAGTPPPPPPPPPGAPVAYVVVPARINVRAQPSPSAAFVRFAVQNEVLQVVNISNGWARLADGTYVFADYITLQTPPVAGPITGPSQPQAPQTHPPAAVNYVVLYARINVRAQPSSTSTWVRFAVKDEVLQVVNIANDWAQLADGTYVFADYIQKA